MVSGSAEAGLVGREHERAALAEALAPAGPLVVFVHGPAGIGKSTLLGAFAEDARRAGAEVVRLDCRQIEPTPQGFLAALTGAPAGAASPAQAAAALAERGDQVVLAIDTYEVFRVSDPWLRTIFAPALAPAVRLVLAGREPPLSSWLDARGGPGRFRSLRLGPLAGDDARALLQDAGLSAPEARAVDRIARGHPLALQIARMALSERPDLRIEDTAVPRAVEELTRLYVDHLDPELRSLLDAASVVRRVTAPLLRAMVPGIAAPAALDRLAGLEIVEEADDGLRLHESVQAAVATRLRTRDPDGHAGYRAAAWRALRAGLPGVPRADLWRHTADMLYLLENPAVREAFFPTTAHLHSVEPAREDDHAEIIGIAGPHETPEGMASLAAWLAACPSAFRVARDRSRAVVGFMAVAGMDAIPYRLVREDPVAKAWRGHLDRHPLPSGQRAIAERWELSRDHGGKPSDVQAALWLDIKRTYLELRPRLGRLYSVSPDPAPYADALATLGFALAPTPILLGREHTVLWLDFGPESVDGWLARLAAAELGIQEERLLDPASLEAVLDGRRVRLSRLEFGVLRCLVERSGRVVDRVTLLEEVWGHHFLGGSNVVDAVVRTLRRKLDDRAEMVETVRGAGYRYRA